METKSNAAILAAYPKSTNGLRRVNSLLDLITTELTVIPNVPINSAGAKELLTLNTENRHITRGRIIRYRDDILENAWIFQGNMVKFDYNRVMRDGQHQLIALIEANEQLRKEGRKEVTLNFNIQLGLEPKAFTVMDTGRNRSGGDALALKGVHDYNIFAAAVKQVLYFEKYQNLRSNISFLTITNGQIDTWTENRPYYKMMEAAVRRAQKIRYEKKALGMAASTWAFIIYTLSRKHREHAADFITKLAYGENISSTDNSPIYFCREKLNSLGKTGEHRNKILSGGTTLTSLKIEMVFTSWNHWRQGEEIPRLKIEQHLDGKIPKPI